MGYIELKNINKSFGKKVIFNNLSYSFEKGKKYGITGVNGSGKSVLFKMISGLMYPDSGSISVNRKELKKGDIPKNIGVLIESPGFISDFTAMENLELLASIKHKSSREDILSVLSLVGLINDKDTKVKNFSLGMLQRLGIAQSIMENPDILILDEPFNSMDSDGVLELRQAIKKYVEENNVILFIVSHNIEDIEYLSDEILKIENNNLVRI